MTTLEIIWMCFGLFMAIGACIFAWMWRSAEKSELAERFWRKYFEDRVKNLTSIRTRKYYRMSENNSTSKR